MRSLICLSSINTVLPPAEGASGSSTGAVDRAASALAFNPESGAVYVATERGETIDIFEIAGIKTDHIQLVGPTKLSWPSIGAGGRLEVGAQPARLRLRLVPMSEPS
jgi:hypothetical protein